MTPAKAIEHAKVKHALRNAISVALTNKTRAGKSIYIERNASDPGDRPRVNIRNLPPRESNHPVFKVADFLVDAELEVHPGDRPVMDDCGVCVEPVVRDADAFEIEVLEALSCVSVTDCAECKTIDIEPGGLFFELDGSVPSAIVRTKVSFTYLPRGQ